MLYSSLDICDSIVLNLISLSNLKFPSTLTHVILVDWFVQVTTMSARRFPSVRDQADASEFSLSGAPSEKVPIYIWLDFLNIPYVFTIDRQNLITFCP